MARKRMPPFETEITKLARGGVGVGVALDGRPMKVRWAPPGCRVAVIPQGKRKGVWSGRRTALIRPPVGWTEPQCPVFGLCGGCGLQELALSDQRSAKQVWALEEVVAGRGALSDEVVVHPVRGDAAGYRYRNKVEMSFGVRRYLSESDLDAGVAIDGSFVGFHAPGRFDRVVDTDSCWLISEAMVSLVRAIRGTALSEGMPPCWDNRAHEGFWRHAVLREARATDQRLVALYTSSAGTEAAVATVAEALIEAGAHGVIWGVDDGVADVARGVVQRTWGSPTIEEHLTTASGRTVRYRLSATSFFQTNTLGAEILYDTVGEAMSGSGTLLDLYCGTGAIGLFLADRFTSVVGVEQIEAAVRDAEDNASRNGVEAQYRVARVEDALDCLEVTGSVSAVVDPPRAGLHPKVARALAEWRGAEELIYVACGPAALGRDAAVLEAGGWRLTALWTVDLFPQTGHVEMVARFVR